MVSQLRSLNINVRVRLLTSFLSRFFGNMVYPFMSIYLTLYFSDQTAGTMLLIITSAAIVMGFLSGYLADIFGKKNHHLGSALPNKRFSCYGTLQFTNIYHP